MLDVVGFEEYSYLFEHFSAISAIPRGSGNCSGIADYLVEFARARGLEYLRDRMNNVLIRKPATEGYEDAPAVILQGHTDIVAERTPDCKKDMSREGLDLFVDGDFIRARGTTLGADNGTAVVYALSVLDGRCGAHPAIEALFTADEETGLFGAAALDGGWLRGRLLLNLDSDREGVFTVGCAGGMQVTVSRAAVGEGYCGDAVRLSVSGLLGGHSGVDIDKRRENATKILAEALTELGELRILSLLGGSKDNAIPRTAECVFIPEKPISAGACEILEKIGAKYRDHEPSISIKLSAVSAEGELRSSEDSAAILSLLRELPSGIVKMSEELEGEVETSLNLGITELTPDALSLSFYVRSSREGATAEVAEVIRGIAEAHGGVAEIASSYPAWEYDPKSPLRERIVRLYRESYGKEPVVNTIHAGLECGVIAAKVDGLDCISTGPDIYDLHTTEEHLSIPSFVAVWKFICDFLKQK